MTRAVFDCVILLQAAARETGPAGACLQAVRNGRLELMACPEILDEVRDVLARPRTLRKFPALTLEAVRVFLEEVTALAVILPEVPKVFTLARDPIEPRSIPGGPRDGHSDAPSNCSTRSRARRRDLGRV